MSLDIMAVASQVRMMAEDVAISQSDFRDRVRWARLLLAKHSDHFHHVAATVKSSKEPRKGRAAVPMDEPLAIHVPAPLCPPSYIVAAVDGSQAEPDRHGHVMYYLINSGTALIRYGKEPVAQFATTPRLYYRHEDMYLIEECQPDWPSTREQREVPVDNEILAMKRSIIELEDLLRLAQNIPKNIPALLMLDGTLTLFAKSTREDTWVGEQLIAHYRHILEAIRDLGLPIAGFISRSNAAWLIEMLQIGACERKVEECAFCRGWPNEGRGVCALTGLRDRFLYDYTLDEPDVLPPLQPGERSAVFQVSASLYQDYDWNEPAMFYLNTGHEIAQVQMPMWVAKDKTLLERVHALVYAQCLNGNGYPTVLARAHEQALITNIDREVLDNLVQAQLVKRGMVLPLSEKARSKQVRAI